MEAVPDIQDTALRTLEEATRAFIVQLNAPYQTTPACTAGTAPSKWRANVATMRALGRLEQHEQRLARLEDDIRAARVSISQRRGQISLATHPIGLAPNEILLEIFSYLIIDDDYVNPDECQKISEVCRHWRQVVCGHGRFWVDVDFSWPAEKFDLWASRAGAVPLRGRLDLGYNGCESNSEVTLRHLQIQSCIVSHRKHSPSISSLLIWIYEEDKGSRDHVQDIINKFFDPELGDFKKLQSLYFVVNDGRLPTPNPSLHAQFLPQSLETLFLEGPEIHCDSNHFSSIVDLTLTYTTQPASAWVLLFHSFERLEELSLYGISVSDPDEEGVWDTIEWPSSNQRVNMKCLHTVSLNMVAPNFYDFFTNYCDLPALRDLVLHIGIIGHMRRASPVTMIRALPLLESIHIHSFAPDEAVMIAIGHVECLRVLELEYPKHAYEDIRESVQRVVARRMSPGLARGKLRYLQLSYCLGSDLPWFEERVEKFEVDSIF